MRPQVEVQRAVDGSPSALPGDAQITDWVEAALAGGDDGARSNAPVEVTVRLVEAEESAELNLAYRHKAGPTNVLSFPFEPPPGLPAEAWGGEAGPRILGDLVICAPVVAREAAAQGKTAAAHWAHMVVHGTLHLLGFDHISHRDAARMETLEIEILDALGYPNPYLETDHDERRST